MVKKRAERRGLDAEAAAMSIDTVKAGVAIVTNGKKSKKAATKPNDGWSFGVPTEVAAELASEGAMDMTEAGAALRRGSESQAGDGAAAKGLKFASGGIKKKKARGGQSRNQKIRHQRAAARAVSVAARKETQLKFKGARRADRQEAKTLY